MESDFVSNLLFHWKLTIWGLFGWDLKHTGTAG